MCVLSVREHLQKHGVTCEEAMRAHMQFILDMEKHIGRPIDLSRYAPTPGHPNQLPPMMG